MVEEVKVYRFKNGDKFFMSKSEKKLLDDLILAKKNCFKSYSEIEKTILEFREKLIIRHEREFTLLEKVVV